MQVIATASPNQGIKSVFTHRRPYLTVKPALPGFLSHINGNGGQNGFISAEGASEALESLLSFSDEDGEGFGFEFQAGDRDGVARWQEFGRVLRANFGIEQYAFVNWTA